MEQPYDIDIKLGSGSAYPIDLDPDIAQRVNDIFNSPGAYYATGGGSSLIIVAPQEALVIYAFKG